MTLNVSLNYFSLKNFLIRRRVTIFAVASFGVFLQLTDVPAPDKYFPSNAVKSTHECMT